MFSLPPELINKVQKFDSKFYKIMKNSLKLKNEEVLIISDYGKGERNLATMLGFGYYLGAKNKKCNVNLLFQDIKKGFMFADNHVMTAIKQLKPNSIILVAVSNKLGRFGEEKSFRSFCKKNGHRFLSATGLRDVNANHFEMFMEAMGVSYSRMKKKAYAIKKKWDKAKEIRVKTKAGTDLVFDVTGKEARVNIGDYHNLGEGGNMPAGEVYIPPNGDQGVNGILVIDGSMKTENGAILIDEPVKVTIKDGRAVKIEGKYAELLEKSFQKYEDRAKYPERIRHVCELGIGLNPGSVLIGSMVMDEKVMGTGHIAMGSNSWFGGDIKTIYHGDHVFKGPVYFVDGKKMDL